MISPACKRVIVGLANSHTIVAKQLQDQQKINDKKTKQIEQLQMYMESLSDKLEESKNWQNAVYTQIQKMTEYNNELSKRLADVYTLMNHPNNSSQQTKQVTETKSIKKKRTKQKVIKTQTPVIYGDSESAKKLSQRKRLPNNDKTYEDDNFQNSTEQSKKNISNVKTKVDSPQPNNENEDMAGPIVAEKNSDVKSDELTEKQQLITTITEQEKNGLKDHGEVMNNDKTSEKEESLENSLRQAAESVVSNSGFTYDETSGMYYDWNTKMYYDTSTQLYYDHENGIYYYYDPERESYIFHSQIKVSTTTDSKSAELEMDKSNNEGELSEGEILSDTDTSSECENDDAVDPCVRIIVVKSDTLPVGSLFIITRQGGTIGREATNQISLPNVAVSRTHARIIYEKSEKTFYIQDNKTQSGTFLNNDRIADPRTSSQPIELTHRDYVTVDDTTFSFHVHIGIETCFDCEPGNIQNIAKNNDTEQAIEFNDLKQQRKKEMKKMMKKYGLSPGYIPQKIISSIPDRAEQRRKTVGSEPYENKSRPVEKASVDKEISETNVGHKMLAKMGWKSGEGLGKSKQGISKPVTVEVHGKNRGLGFGETTGIERNNTRKKEILDKTKERFNKLSDT